MQYKLTLAFLALVFGLQAQTNYGLNLLSNFDYAEDGNDIWGWVHPTTGVEYALMGTREKTSIVSLANPAAPVEVQTITGSNSIWRDIKTWGNYAYVTTDQGNDGLLIIDLSGLPNNISYNFWKPELTINNNTDTLLRAHNIYIDEGGYAYIAGSNISNGEPFFLDLNVNPAQPTLAGFVPPIYAHDVYARGDTLWTSDIYVGEFTGYDVSNKANPIALGSQSTPDNFTHNAWISDDGNTLFTTDERANAYIGSYDVSDMSNIVELDRWQPYETIGEGVIPHNVHVKDEFLIISYYTDGLIVVDAQRPDNLVEVAKYDSYTGQNSGFFGCWGAYPFFSSGKILAADINTGLYVFDANYQRACWLEGLVTDSVSGNPIFGARVEINNTAVFDDSRITGEYKTGYGVAGSYSVTFSKAGYFPKTISVNLAHGQVSQEDVELVPMQAFSLSGQVIDSLSGSPIANAIVELKSPDYSHMVNTDNSGNFNVPSMFQDDYEVLVGKWGHHSKLLSQNLNASSGQLTVELVSGYRDEFALDLGWTNSSTATSGDWARANSEGLSYNGSPATPDGDLNFDLGELCYITGDQNNGAVGGDDIDGGDVILRSPDFDVLDYGDAYINFYAWFYNGGGSGAPNDSMIVRLHNGLNSAVLAVYTNTNGWTNLQSFRIADYLPPVNNMWIEVLAFDRNGGHIAEGAIDLFSVVDASPTGIEAPQQLSQNKIQLHPNPSQHSFMLRLEQPLAQDQMIMVYNSLGQLMAEQKMTAGEQQLEIGAHWPSGTYYLRLGQEKAILLQKLD